MQYGLWLYTAETVDVDALVELGVAAEKAGWDGVFASDSLPFGNYPSPWVTLGAIATRTDEIALGTWVVPAARYEPWQLALEVASLDQLSDGRVLLGVGLGNDDEYEAFGTPYVPRDLAERLDETLDVLAGLWTGEPFDYDGEHFQLADAVVDPTPVQEPHPPILAGAWWPNRKPIDRGARWDGIMPYFASLSGNEGPHGEDGSGEVFDEVEAALAHYRDVADDQGDVLLPMVPEVDPATYVDDWAAQGATWLLETTVPADADGALDRIRAGPPA